MDMDKKHVRFEWDSHNRKFRVWRSDAPGDVFDLVTSHELVDKLTEAMNDGYWVLPGLPLDEAAKPRFELC